MAKRGYKLQEFVAHSSNVNCLSIGKKACRLLLTGSDDHKVNLWAIGKPISLMSLCGHTSPVESVTFDSAEVLVVAGASSGMIKLWDLEEAKMIRSLYGHKMNCTAVGFHPFGEFFASGSMDSNLKIWDIKKKECIHTYKGHSQGISTIKFSPDGRWVVSGGHDNAVKIWDLTAGKLLHDFKFHEGAIRAIDFHPLEFLLATGSADKTVKFWDLETFELIGSARPEATGVRSIAFHPDGRTLFCGLEDSLKVYSWEPLIRHDAVDMGWSTLGDLCIHDGKALGCSYHQNSVGVWVADISLIEPYGAGLAPKQTDYMEQKYNPLASQHSVEKVVTSVKGTHSFPTDYETKEIKNIYVDSTGGKPVASETARSLTSPKVVMFPPDSKETNDLPTQKKSLAASLLPKSNEQAFSKSIAVPSAVPRESPAGKYPGNSRRESSTPTKPSSDNLGNPMHTRRQSNTKFDAGRLSMTDNSGTLSTRKSYLNKPVNPNFKTKPIHQGDAKESSEDNLLNIHNDAQKIEKLALTERPPSREYRDTFLNSSQEIASVRVVNGGDTFLNSSQEIASVRVVNGVSVVRGRTRSLVEKFEKREEVVGDNDDSPICLPPQIIPAADKTCIAEIAEPQISERGLGSANDEKISADLRQRHDLLQAKKAEPQTYERKLVSTNDDNITDDSIQAQKGEAQIYERELDDSANNGKITDALMQNHDVFLSTLKSRLTKLQVVRHFWERKETKGAINALRKLPDHSVQADFVTALAEKIDTFNLDLFSCLIPMLTSLLNSKRERHVNVTLEMLVKLVGVFGPLINSTVAAPPSVGVDLHAEQRREQCKQCFIHLQKIEKVLPELVRRGGLVAKCAMELSILLQQ